MSVLAALIDFCSLIVLAAVLLSWIPAAGNNVVGRSILRVTEPVFARVRSVIPTLGGLDLSPMLVLIALRFVRGLIE
jgi:YggT family protein